MLSRTQGKHDVIIRQTDGGGSAHLGADRPSAGGLIVEDEKAFLWFARLGRGAGEDAGDGGATA